CHLLIAFYCTDRATPEIYTLSLHDALPICRSGQHVLSVGRPRAQSESDREPDSCDGKPSGDQPTGYSRVDDIPFAELADQPDRRDRKSTRLNSSHSQISYAVFCLKKKKRNL